MTDEEPGGPAGFGDEVSRMLKARALRHPDHTDPLGLTRRSLKAAHGRRRTVLGATATLAVAGGAVFASSAIGGAGGHSADRARESVASPTHASSNRSGASQITVLPRERAKDVVASLIQTRKWSPADFDAAISGNTIGLPAWSKDSAGHQYTIEGMLEPGTYAITSADTPQSVLKEMVSKRVAFLDGIGFVAKAAKLHCGSAACTPEEVLNVASIAEAEVTDPADGTRVAEGIYNRLATNDYLGIDSTSRYALDLPAGQAPTAAQARDPKNPYSTYAHRGLPPTPIDVTSDAMIKAALAPSDEGVYFWCTGAKGTKFFKKPHAGTFVDECAPTH